MKDHAGHEMDASDFGDVRTNIGVCPNCGRFDWVLVANRSADITVDNDKGLLWACPCGEFKWTSYAEWEKKQSREQVDTATQVMTAQDWDALVGGGDSA